MEDDAEHETLFCFEIHGISAKLTPAAKPCQGCISLITIERVFCASIIFHLVLAGSTQPQEDWALSPVGML